MAQEQQHKGLRCCPVCRLVQPVADECRGCGAGTPGRLRRRKGAFFARRMTFFVGKKVKETIVRGLGAVIVAGVFSVLMYCGLRIDRDSPPIQFFPFLLGGGIAVYGVAVMIKGLVSAINPGGSHAPLAPRFTKLPPALLAGRGATFSGTAAASGGKVSAFLRPEECLAAFLTVGRQGDGSLFLRGVRGVGFLIEQTSGDPLFVTGNTWVVGEPKGATSTPREGFSALGFDPEQFIEGPGPGHAMEIILREGDEVEVTGPESREAVPGLATGYRDGGPPVLHGTPREPVLVRFVS